MIEIKPVNSYDELKKIYEKCGIELCDFCMAITAADNDKRLGECLFSLTPKGIFIKDINPKNDLSLADGILRSALHVAVFNNVNNAYYEQTAPADVFDKLGFILDRQNRTLNIAKLSEGCGCGINK